MSTPCTECNAVHPVGWKSPDCPPKKNRSIVVHASVNGAHTEEVKTTRDLYQEN